MSRSIENGAAKTMSESAENPFSRPSGAFDNRGDQATTSLDARSGLADIKGRVHRLLIERLNLANLETIERDHAVNAIRQVIQELLEKEAFALNLDEREEIKANARATVLSLLGKVGTRQVAKDLKLTPIELAEHINAAIEADLHDLRAGTPRA